VLIALTYDMTSDCHLLTGHKMGACCRLLANAITVWSWHAVHEPVVWKPYFRLQPAKQQARLRLTAADDKRVLYATYTRDCLVGS
jgi:hypothetical protein